MKPPADTSWIRMTNDDRTPGPGLVAAVVLFAIIVGALCLAAWT
jgi:hypothetical protein